MLFIIGRSLFVLCQDYCCKHLSFLERWGEEATDGTCTTNGGSILTNVPLYDKMQNIAYLAAAGPGSNEDRYQDVKQDPYRYTHPEVYQDQLEDLFPHDVFPALFGGAGSAVVCGMVGWNGRRGLKICISLQQICTKTEKKIMGKWKVVSLYRCDLWFLPVNAIRLLGKRGNKHYQTGIMEECGPETQGDTSGIAFVWNCLYTYDTIIILNNVSEFLTLPV